MRGRDSRNPTNCRGQSASPLSFTSNTASPTKQSFAQGDGSFWFDKSYDEDANDTRYTDDTFDCRDSQLSLNDLGNSTGFTDGSDLTGYTNQTELTGEYTADTFRSNTDERRMPAKKNAERKRVNPTKKAVYNGKKVDKSLHDGEAPDARDDAAAFMLDMLEERSNGSTEDRYNCSQSAISRSASAESGYTDFTADTYGDASTAYSQFTTQTGTSSFNTFGFFSRKEMMKATNFGEPNVDEPRPLGLLSGIAMLTSIHENATACAPTAHDAIVDENDEVETQDGSIQSNQFDDGSAGKVERGVTLVPTAAPTSKPGIDANLPHNTKQNKISVEDTPNNSPDQFQTKTNGWLGRIPSFTKKIGFLPTSSSVDEQSTDASPIVSETVIKVHLPKNDETDGEIASDETSAINDDLPNEENTLLAQQKCDENTGTVDTCNYTKCFCTPSESDRNAHSTDVANIELQNGDGQDKKNIAVVPESQNIATDGINRALADLFGYCSISKLVPSSKDSQTPTQSTMFEDQDDKNAALLVDLDVVATYSDGDSTFDATEVLLNAPNIEPSPKAKSRQVLNDPFFGLGRISKRFPSPKNSQRPTALDDHDEQPYVLPELLPGGLDIVATQSDGNSTFEASGADLSEPFFETAESRPELDEISALTGVSKASKKKGIPLTLPNFGRKRSVSCSKGITKPNPSAVSPTRSQSTRNSRQDTPRTSAWSRSTNSSAVSINCGNSQREFHIPATVASSAMSVASSRSRSNARNIYAKSNGRRQRRIQRLSQGRRSNMKSTYGEKIHWQESLD